MSWLERIDEREARRFGRSLQRTAVQTGQAAQHQLTDFAHEARAIAEPVLHQAADHVRREGAMVARAATAQAMRATRAVRADPVPAIVGAIGLVLFANLFLSRRRKD